MGFFLFNQIFRDIYKFVGINIPFRIVAEVAGN
jgi:hypothetical protein